MAPHDVFYELKQLVEEQAVIAIIKSVSCPCEMYHLPGQEKNGILLAYKIGLERTWHNFASRSRGESFGRQGEKLIRNAFLLHDRFTVADKWGCITSINGKPLPSQNGERGTADGFVTLTMPNNGGIGAIIEVKNEREHKYPKEADVWYLAYKAFEVNAVPILFARKIHPSTRRFVFARIGGLGFEMHRQFIPPSMETALRECKHKDGLGFHDLYFRDNAPPNIDRVIEIAEKWIPVAFKRMQLVRPIVMPYLAELARTDIDRHDRNDAYWKLQRDLDAFDIRHSSMIDLIPFE